jgi:ATP-dependent Clp protease ATP-binding subunit ClpA
MVHQQDGESLEHSSLNETTTPATTVEFLQLIQSIISHPSIKGAQMNSVISLLLANIATTLKAQRPNKNTIENEQKRKKNEK